MPHKKNHSLRVKTIRLGLGYGFLFFGILGGFLPILQGWIFVALGLILLKDHARWARGLSIWLRRKYPEARPVFKKVYKKIDEWLEMAGLS